MRHNQHPDEPERQTIKRHHDEPKLQIGDAISIKEGFVGIVLARYMPSGGRNEVHYVVELRPVKTKSGKTEKAQE